WTSFEAIVPLAPEAAAPVVEGAVERRAHVGLSRVEVHAGELVGKGRGVIRPGHEHAGEVPVKGSRPRSPQRRATAPATEGAEARRDENGDVARDDAPPDVGSVLKGVQPLLAEGRSRVAANGHGGGLVVEAC